jgi:hypothetical protein
VTCATDIASSHARRYCSRTTAAGCPVDIEHVGEGTSDENGWGTLHGSPGWRGRASLIDWRATADATTPRPYGDPVETVGVDAVTRRLPVLPKVVV